MIKLAPFFGDEQNLHRIASVLRLGANMILHRFIYRSLRRLPSQALMPFFIGSMLTACAPITPPPSLPSPISIPSMPSSSSSPSSMPSLPSPSRPSAQPSSPKIPSGAPPSGAQDSASAPDSQKPDSRKTAPEKKLQTPMTQESLIL